MKIGERDGVGDSAALSVATAGAGFRVRSVQYNRPEAEHAPREPVEPVQPPATRRLLELLQTLATTLADAAELSARAAARRREASLRIHARAAR